MFVRHLDYSLIFIAAGALLLLLGRRLFWFFVAAGGFVAGLELAPKLFPHQPETVILIIAAVLGLFGALLAIFVQKIAISVAGFLAGGGLGVVLCTSGLALHSPGILLIAFVIGGIIGAFAMMVFFNWALMILSSFLGARLVVDQLHLRHPQGAILLLILILLGVAVQASTYRRPAGQK
jgi:hypothetical protein